MKWKTGGQKKKDWRGREPDNREEKREGGRKGEKKPYPVFTVNNVHSALEQYSNAGSRTFQSETK